MFFKVLKECRVAHLIMLCAGMMFTVTVRLKDGGFEGGKILVFKFLAILSGPPSFAPLW